MRHKYSVALFLLIFMLAPALVQAQTETQAERQEKIQAKIEAQQFITQGWQEAVIIAHDQNYWQEFFVDIGHWKLVERGRVPKSWLAFWQLETHTARYSLYQNPGNAIGMVRVITFKNTSGQPDPLMRPNTQSWDTGGYFDIGFRVRDMAHMRQRLMAQGWQGATEPIKFTFGPFEVIEWLPRGADGVQIAVIERIKPPLEGWPHLVTMSRSFNATMIVKDAIAASQFWEVVLGFKIYLQNEGRSQDNVLGLPLNWSPKITRKVLIMHPDGSNDGSIELLSFHEATGRDLSKRTDLPHRGIYSLRFPIRDFDGMVAHLQMHGIEPLAIGRDLPFTSGTSKKADFISLRAPGGAVVELFKPR